VPPYTLTCPSSELFPPFATALPPRSYYLLFFSSLHYRFCRSAVPLYLFLFLYFFANGLSNSSRTIVDDHAILPSLCTSVPRRAPFRGFFPRKSFPFLSSESRPLYCLLWASLSLFPPPPGPHFLGSFGGGHRTSSSFRDPPPNRTPSKARDSLFAFFFPPLEKLTRRVVFLESCGYFADFPPTVPGACSLRAPESAKLH